MQPLIIIILVLYLASMIGIGIFCSKKTANIGEYVLGGRNVGAWFTAFAYGTSYFSAVVFIGYSGQFGWNYGIAATWIGIGNAFIGSMLAWMLLGKRTRVMTKHLNCSTMPEFFEKRYNSKSLKIVSAAIIFVFLIPYTASVYNGLSRLFESTLHIDYSVCIIVMAVLTAVYVILGGYKATAVNDFIQGIIMLIGIVLVVVLVACGKGGFSSNLSVLGGIEDPSLGINKNELNSLFGPDPINLLGVVILTSLGTWGLPQMATKFYAIKDDSAIKRGCVISTVFALVVAGGSYFMGGFGRVYVNGADITLANEKLAFDDIVPAMLSSTLPEILIGVVIVLVLSASMSTLASLVLASSSTLTVDLIKPFLKKELSEKKQVLVMRAFVGVFVIISVVIALNKNTYISTLMSISWGALAGAFLAPYLYGLFSKKITKPAVWASFIGGVGVTIAHMFVYTFKLIPDMPKSLFGLNLASPINAGAFAMILGLIIVPVVSAFTKQSEKDRLNTEDVFTCLSEKKENVA